MSTLAKDEKCHVDFFTTHCLFQDLLTGTTIGAASESDGIYYLNDNAILSSSSCNKVYLSKTNNLELWHKRLGHLNFKYMSRMFPFICSKNNVSQFYYDDKGTQ